MSNPLAPALTRVTDEIQQAQQTSGRKPDSVKLLAVSKTQPVDALRCAHALGLRHFGENYVNEGVDKVTQLTDLDDIHWHFIGALQTNKTRLIATHFHWMQSLSRIRIAERLSEQRPETMPALQICIQINPDQEDSKSGLRPDEAIDFCRQISRLPNLTLRGIMAIPAPRADYDAQYHSGLALHTLFQTLRQEFPGMDTLSLGMSADLKAAIHAGSTMVRIGTALFGRRARPHPLITD